MSRRKILAWAVLFACLASGFAGAFVATLVLPPERVERTLLYDVVLLDQCRPWRPGP